MDGNSLFYVIAKTEEKYLEAAEKQAEQVSNESNAILKEPMPRRIRLGIILAAGALLLCLGATVGIWLYHFESTPFHLIAVASDETRTLIRDELNLNEAVRINQIGLGQDVISFQITYEVDDPLAAPEIIGSIGGVLSYAKVDTPFSAQPSVWVKNGKRVEYYYLKASSVPCSFEFLTPQNSSCTGFLVTMQVEKEEGRYVARLISTERKIGTGDANEEPIKLSEAEKIAEKEEINIRTAPYEEIVMRLNAENGWDIDIPDENKALFNQLYSDIPLGEFENEIRNGVSWQESNLK